MVINDTHYVRGAQRLGRRINTIRTNLNLPALHNEVGELLLRRFLVRFDRQVSPDDVPWLPLADSTVLRRKRLGLGPTPKLVRTRDMRDAIKVIHGRADGGVFANTGAGLRIGIDDEDIAKYGKVHNNGSGGGRTPQRRFLGIGRLDVKAVDSLLRRKARKLEI
jgi:hypothetical protein